MTIVQPPHFQLQGDAAAGFGVGGERKGDGGSTKAERRR
jgi:hypothetical protein